MPSVEQNKLKRAGTGLRAFDPERAWPRVYPICSATKAQEARFT